MAYLDKGQLQFIERTIDNIAQSIYTRIGGLDISVWRTKEPVPFCDRKSGEFSRIKTGDNWGKLFDCAWMHFEGTVPESAKGGNVALQIDINGEACIFDDTGCPDEGLTCVDSQFEPCLGNPGKDVYPITDCALGNEKISLWADCGNNDLFGKYVGNGTIKQADIVLRNTQLQQLFYECMMLLDYIKNAPNNTARYAKIFDSLYRALSCIRNYTSEEASQASTILSKELKRKNGDYPLTITAIGHAHIDLAWLWPIRESVRKGARTFATALKNLDRYPRYMFGSSQPQLYKWMKDYYPPLYEKVKTKIAEGRWEAQGAMWVEADVNVAGGEALVRQLLHGKRFYRQEFGKDIKVLFLPDVFGYSAALPQLLVKSGVPYFMTQKLSWNTYNEHPHHTFLWSGIDGSKVLSHMLPENTYNSPGQPRSMIQAEQNFHDKTVCDEALMLYGIGDGGGGPGSEHIESISRLENFMSLPPVKSDTTENFFKRQEKVRKRLATWQGELYLERHQGTYTSFGRVKYYNTLMEKLLRELEMALSRQVIASKDFKYPHAELDEIWQEVMLYQFHDILPGSSIDRVYDECIARYKILSDKITSMLKKSYSDIAPRGNNYLNTLNWERSEWVKTDNGWQYVTTPPLSLGSAKIIAKKIRIKVANNAIENQNLSIKFNNDGSIKSIYDKINKQETLSGAGNVLSIYVDEGDCWDIHDQARAPFSVILMNFKSYIDGPCAIMENTYTFNSSTITQKVILTDGSKRADFETIVDWQEEKRMLRTAFPVDVHVSEVECGIQFGSIKRTTTDNTLWDAAKTEICAQKWVDLSRPDYGVSLITDCKYGYKVKGNVMDINLIRGALYPSYSADKGIHHFTYSFFPHAGTAAEANTMAQMYELNFPIRQITGTKNIVSVDTLADIDMDNIIIESIKKAEDSNDIIIRLYESAGKKTTAKIDLGFRHSGVWSVNLMEENPANISLSKLSFKPYEIISLKISL